MKTQLIIINHTQRIKTTYNSNYFKPMHEEKHMISLPINITFTKNELNWNNCSMKPTAVQLPRESTPFSFYKNSYSH